MFHNDTIYYTTCCIITKRISVISRNKKPKFRGKTTTLSTQTKKNYKKRPLSNLKDLYKIYIRSFLLKLYQNKQILIQYYFVEIIE